MSGKGSKRRPEDVRKVRKNWDAIKWKPSAPKLPDCHVCKDRGWVYVQFHLGRLRCRKSIQRSNQMKQETDIQETPGPFMYACVVMLCCALVPLDKAITRYEGSRFRRWFWHRRYNHYCRTVKKSGLNMDQKRATWAKLESIKNKFGGIAP